MNSLKEGYKKTELGFIPNEWEIKKLKSIVDICYGKSQKDVEVEDGKYKILGTGGVIGYTNDFLWNEPSVLIGRKGTIDKPQYIEEPFWTVDTLFYTKLKDNNIAKWLYYYVNNIDLKKYNEATGVPSLSVGNLNLINIAVPPLKEQEKIAEIISTVDYQIDDTEKLIEKTKELKRGLMQRLLTKGIRHTEFKNTEVGEIPVEWKVKRLGDVCKFIGGYAFKSSDYVNEGIKLIKITNVQQNNLIWNEKDYLPEEYLEKYLNYKMKKDDVVMAMTRPIISTGLKVCIIKESDLPCLLNQRVGKFEVESILDSRFLYQYTFTIYFINKVKELSSTTGQPNISSSQVESILIPIPTIKEQKEIVNILSSVDKQIEEYENKKIKLEELKNGLIQKLLTGNIRVEV